MASGGVSRIFFFATFLGISLLGCARPDLGALPFSSIDSSNPEQNAIVAGQFTTEADPLGKATVLLQISRFLRRGEICTGVLVGPRLVLTAAHCLAGRPSSVTVRFGVMPLSPTAPSPKVRALDWRVHPEAKSGRSSRFEPWFPDLALVWLSDEVPKGVRPIALAPPELSLSPRENLVLIGYGVIEAGFQLGAGTSRRTNVFFHSRLRSDSRAIVGYREGTSICFGDSGGPAFVLRGSRTFVVGIAHGVTSAECEDRVIYTDVSHFHPWLKSAAVELEHEGVF